MQQNPPQGSATLSIAGSNIEITLSVPSHFPAGKAFVRGTFYGDYWSDIELLSTHCGSRRRVYSAVVALDSVRLISYKTYFLPNGKREPIWTDGKDALIKVAPEWTRCGASIYTAFTRQFRDATSDVDYEAVAALDRAGYTVIPPSGTFRNLAKRLDHIIGELGFHIIQLLPIHPTPTTYARMGRFGSPFAGLDFMSVDPALAEFDTSATPMEQFEELVDAVHARGAQIFLDLPANHTGWASTFQIHHPEWFRRNEDGSYHSPGAWGVTWEDLVELDYSHNQLREAVAEVFLFWCEKGVDGFRCDAGYMIPADAWAYIVKRVREIFPNTVFLLEGLGGKLETTDRLLSESGLDWAYSEIFQEEDRDSLSHYLPGAIARSESIGPLVNFAETHDNNRLAARGNRYASMRTALAALLSQQGAFGITAGVEWYCREKIDVHGAPSLSWGNGENQIALISRLNALLDCHPAFAAGAKTELITQGGGNVITALRTTSRANQAVLAVINLDCESGVCIEWNSARFAPQAPWDLISSRAIELTNDGSRCTIELPPGGFALISDGCECLKKIEKYEERRRELASYHSLTQSNSSLKSLRYDEHEITPFSYPADSHRVVMVPPNSKLVIDSPFPFRALLRDEGQKAIVFASSVSQAADKHAAILKLPKCDKRRVLSLELTVFGEKIEKAKSVIWALPSADKASLRLEASGERVRQGEQIEAILANRRGAMAKVNAAFGEITSQYDAMLALNPDLHVPANKQVFFTRCKAWVRHCGYSFALDVTSLDSFRLLSERTACWVFTTQIGGGKKAKISITHSLDDKSNASFTTVKRLEYGDRLADDTPIDIILRPDVEARDFHGPTLAYTGPERSYPNDITHDGHGFVFEHPGAVTASLRIDNGSYRHEPKWSYNVAHPLEAERGLHPSGDLFSPGWFLVTMRPNEEATLTAKEAGVTALSRTESVAYPAEISFKDWLSQNPSNLFIADRDEFKTVIAGYPWFLDWGRDTLIVLRGLIAAGKLEESLAILREFGRFEECGTLPNIIHGETVGNRDTSDAPLWFIVASGDAMKASTVDKVANLSCGARSLRDVIISIVENYISGTPNGIRADKKSGLIFSPSHFTWMDTNYPAGTPRIGYPIEIQALWIASLALLREELGVTDYADIEKTARKSLVKYYRLPTGWLADNLRPAGGQFESAENCIKEDAMRPNQLLAITLGAIDISTEAELAESVVNTTERLLVPGGIRSLADQPVKTPMPVWHNDRLLNDPQNPYWGYYTGDEDTRRKPAYHNGTAWGWQFPLWAEAKAKVYGEKAIPGALAILASSTALMETGALGHIPEIMDGNAPHTGRGCSAQAWSMSELQRVYIELSALS